MRHIFILMSLILATGTFVRSAYAEWDYQFGFSSRTVPFGGIVSGTLGYGLLLWGEDPMASMPLNGPSEGVPVWKYGYIRPNLTVSTIGITNRVAAEVEIFPISVFGIAVGQGYRTRMDQSFQFDCQQTMCGGLLSKTYVRGQLVAGALGGFAILTGRYDLLNHPTGSLPFLEETANLLGAPGRDEMASVSATLGYTMNSRWVVGAQSYFTRFMRSGDHSVNHFAFINHYFDRWGILVGGGTYSSTHQPLSPTFIGLVQFNGKRALGLF